MPWRPGDVGPDEPALAEAKPKFSPQDPLGNVGEHLACVSSEFYERRLRRALVMNVRGADRESSDLHELSALLASRWLIASLQYVFSVGGRGGDFDVSHALVALSRTADDVKVGTDLLFEGVDSGALGWSSVGYHTAFF